MNWLSRQWHHCCYKVECKRQMYFSKRAQWIKVLPYMCKCIETKGWKKEYTESPKQFQSYGPFHLFLFPPFFNKYRICPVRGQSSRAKGKTGQLTPCWKVIDGISSAPSTAPSGLWIRSHSYLASLTHMKDSKELNTKHLIEKLCECTQFEELPTPILFWFRIFVSCILMSE